jgi:predicted metal-dependent hydrolase
MLYTVERRAKKTLEIAVLPDSTIFVSAPMDASEEAIERRVRKRSKWIRAQLAYFREFEPKMPPRHYVAGETQLYLGKRYRLRILAGEEQVRIDTGYLAVRAPDPAPSSVERSLRAWYRESAERVFPPMLDAQWDRFDYIGEDRPRLCVKILKRRWGSLSERGALTLNLDLIQVPRACIEYVICHELCHLKHRGHGPGFYSLLARMMPDWRERKQRLERSSPLNNGPGISEKRGRSKFVEGRR